MGSDFGFQIKFTIFGLKLVLRVNLDFFAPDLNKSSSKYLLFTKVVKKLGVSASQSFKLSQTHILKVFWTKFSVFFGKYMLYMIQVF